ncbi:MAG: CRISPR-associated endoribonuclease Cas6 [Eubacterium sp.]|nr:CRISPR-associated endoribonuclease Cas6 [Eubacterium sp.]
MLVELRMKLDTCESDFGYYQSSILQGILMEQMDTNYARRMHEQGWRPYSQYLDTGSCKEWVVKTCTQEAYQEIILPLLSAQFTQFTIEKKNMQIKILEKNSKIIPKKELLEEFYSNSCSHYLNFAFLTPASFKSNGRYIIMPDARYIFQSLMNKYSAASKEMDMYDSETLTQLSENSRIVRYRLSSTFFPVEGVKIPAFKGELSIKTDGTDTMARYARLLARFGEYSGVGIKTAMGMGALKIKERGSKER